MRSSGLNFQRRIKDFENRGLPEADQGVSRVIVYRQLCKEALAGVCLPRKALGTPIEINLAMTETVFRSEANFEIEAGLS